MMPSSLIRITQQLVERTFGELQKEISNYARLQNDIHTNLDRLQNLTRAFLMDRYPLQSLDLIFTLKNANDHMVSVSQRSLREIDTLTATISSYLSLLLDECIENYTSDLKIWLRIRLDRLIDLREFKIKGVSNYITFPIAVSILSPYIIKTRLCDKDTSERLVSIRNLIRSLSEPCY